MSNIDRLIFQPEGKTNWDCDSVALFRRYDSKQEALDDVSELRSRGWIIDSAYPNEVRSPDRCGPNQWEVAAVFLGVRNDA